METFDFVVIGAGVFGLGAAKTFHQLYPEKSLVVFDSGSTLGGVWSLDRLYPGLKTNNMLGTFEYPDFPMDSDTFGIKPGEHMSGELMFKYLTQYAKTFGILDKIRHDSAVTTAQHQDGAEGGWILTVQNGDTQRQVFARKLVMAAGLTSEPFFPHIEGQEQFGVPVFHSKDFAKHADTLESAKKVTVFGGTKSAWDVVYTYASKGVKVDWVIRSSGHGPIWISPPYVTPLKKWLEKLVHTRLLTWFSPCIWGDADGYRGIRRFFHGTAIGRSITNAFWSVLGNDVLTLNQYDSHPELRKLKPWSQAMFTASSFSILNYPTNIFDFVRDGTIKVHIADLTGLSARTVHLSDGTQLDTDALCCVTGWKHVPPVKFLPEGIDKELGLPHKPSESGIFTPQEVREADEIILSRFPRLRDQPVQNKNLEPLLASKSLTTTDEINPSTLLTPWALYHFMVPASPRFLRTRDVAFAGVLLNFSTFMVAHAQAIWIAAYFNDQLPERVLPSRLSISEQEAEEGSAGFGLSSVSDGQKDTATAITKTAADVRRETRLHARFGRWRYPAGHGMQFPDFVFDALPYIDLLVSDLGLKVHRKSGWLAEMTEPYGPEDYRDLVEEFVASVGRERV
ncbi:hypothetical protein C7999DRAFT_28045 [Corynascus novoguineensis]|uniref:Flavin-containing monooxygenase n=1 Tax=Corynascus novoguineensis TaxID=1126955 RepID=A0AAN7HU11_9PEZI|nr:hypothetical protein C7999DRAFT_28045 [Corynascus novoguineensis]